MIIFKGRSAVKRKLKVGGVLIYWAGCVYIFISLMLNNGWQQFFDITSLVVTFLPAFLALFLSGSENLPDRISRSLNIMWVSAAFIAVYSFICALSENVPFETEVLAVGAAIAMLPVLYALSAHLLIIPFVWNNQSFIKVSCREQK